MVDGTFFKRSVTKGSKSEEQDMAFAFTVQFKSQWRLIGDVSKLLGDTRLSVLKVS